MPCQTQDQVKMGTNGENQCTISVKKYIAEGRVMIQNLRFAKALHGSNLLMMNQMFFGTL